MALDRRSKFIDALPLLVVICLMPFVVYGHMYEYTGDSFGTFAEGAVLTDFFSYAKTVLFMVAGTYMLFRLVYDFTQGRLHRPCLVMFISLVVLEFCFLLSAILANNMYLAFFGGYQRFEGLFVKLFYLILSVYSFHVIGSAGVRQILWKGTVVVAALESLVGLAQMTGHDPFATAFVQNIILPAEYRGSEITNILGDNRVYLTLGNPNYAAMFLSVMIIFLTCSCLFVSNRKWVPALAVLDVLCFVELIATRSRVGILMLGVAGVLGAVLGLRALVRSRRNGLSLNKGNAFLLGGLLVLLVCAGLVTDTFMDHGMNDRIETTVTTLGKDRRNCVIEDLKTGKESVMIKMPSATLSVAFGARMDQNNLKISSKEHGELTEEYDVSTGDLDIPEQGGSGAEDRINIVVEEIDQEPIIKVTIGETFFYFAYDDQLGYQVYTGNGYYEETEEIPHLDMHGLESAASGRGYIWSRTIPLIKGYRIFTGYGSDNFYLAFPQNDFLGKAWYCESPYAVVEKPHSTYLLYTVENGIFAMLALVILILAMIVRCIREEGRLSSHLCITITLIMAAFATGFIFNDSSIVISPLFWICLGAGYGLTSSERESGQ